jgi:hypothetical protein
VQNFSKNWGVRIWGGIAALALLAGMIAALIDIGKYINEKNTPTATPIIPTPTHTAVPTDTPTPTPGPFQFAQLPAEIKVGSDVTVSLQAPPGAVCLLEFYTPDGNRSTAKGLGQTVANSQGRCSWEWHVSGNTGAGGGRLVVSMNGITETHEVEVVK